MEQEARGGVAGEHGGSAEGQQAGSSFFGVVQDDVEGVLDVGLVAVAADAGGDGGGWAEEGEGLIDEMRAEVEEHAVGRVFGFLPGGLALDGAEAVEVGLEGDEAAYGFFFDELAYGEEVAVPAAIVKGSDDKFFAGGEIPEFFGLGAGGGEGLVDDDVLACDEGLFGEGEVSFVGSGDDYELDGGIGEGFFERAEDVGIGVGFGGFVALALDDCFEFQAGHGGDEGGVEDLSTQAEAYYCYSNIGAHVYLAPMVFSAG